MPFRKPRVEPPPPAPADWRPQAIGKRSFRSIHDPVVEPGWGGVRVIARVVRGADDSATVSLTDEEGVDATAEFGAVANAIGAAALADELILDGFLTIEATQPSEGRGLPEPGTPGKGQVIGHLFMGGRVRTPQPDRELDPERPIAFVAIDLLLIDGTRLIDLPLIERKRFLDSALQIGELVRVTPYVRPPIGSLAMSWHAIGFREMVFKSANGRYNADGRPGDWAVVPIRPR